MKKKKILVIEDDPDFREALAQLLGKDFAVEMAENGVAGVKSALLNPPDIVLVDLRMPGMDGFQTCKALRMDADLSDTPIIVVSGFNSTSDRTRAFEAGADDFIPKPFNTEEFLARLHRKLSTASAKSSSSPVSAKSSIITCGNIHLDLEHHDLEVNGQSVPLSDLEFRLMHQLMIHCGHVISRKDLIDNVWGNQEVSDRIVDPHIVSIRNKLSAATASISSIYGKGYILKHLK